MIHACTCTLKFTVSVVRKIKTSVTIGHFFLNKIFFVRCSVNLTVTVIQYMSIYQQVQIINEINKDMQ